MSHTRTELELVTATDAQKLCSVLNSDGTADKYVLENYDGTYRLNPRSYMQIICAIMEFPDGIFLVNDTHNGVYPAGVDEYRK